MFRQLILSIGLAAALTVPIAATAAVPSDAARPGFVLHDAYGQPVSLAGYRGSVVWLTFGATW